MSLNTLAGIAWDPQIRGFLATAVGVVVLTVLTVHDDGSTTAEVGLTAPDLLVGGMWTILLFQLAGYSVAWAVWWLKHR